MSVSKKVPLLQELYKSVSCFLMQHFMKDCYFAKNEVL